MAKLSMKEARLRRHRRIRGKVSGTAAKPRMSVFRTSKHLYVQLIDDEAQRTLVAASTLDASFREAGNKTDTEGAAALGKVAAERALAADITQAVFDRGGFRYHGRIAALAAAAREAGLRL